MLIIELSKQLAELTAVKRELESKLNDINKQCAALKEQMIAEHATSGMGSSFKLADGTQVIFSEKSTAKVEDKEKMVAWFLDHNLRDMLGVHSQTLLAFCNEELSEFRPIPDGVTVGKFKQVTIRKSDD